MKLINILLLIFLWNTTYRCKKDDLLIDCENATIKMMGTWKGTQYNNAKTFNDQFVLKVTSYDGCHFFGETSYSQSPTTFSISGNIDMYGWIKFTETKYIVNGGEYDNCSGSYWSSCRYIRWRPGAEFEDARFNEETFSGKWSLSWSNSGGFNLVKE